MASTAQVGGASADRATVGAPPGGLSRRRSLSLAVTKRERIPAAVARRNIVSEQINSPDSIYSSCPRC